MFMSKYCNYHRYCVCKNINHNTIVLYKLYIFFYITNIITFIKKMQCNILRLTFNNVNGTSVRSKGKIFYRGRGKLEKCTFWSVCATSNNERVYLCKENILLFYFCVRSKLERTFLKRKLLTYNFQIH